MGDFLSPEALAGLDRPSYNPIQTQTNYSGSIPNNYEEQSKAPGDGSVTMHGIAYVVKDGQTTVNGEKLNSPTLGIRNNEVFYYDVGGKQWILLGGTDVEKVIQQSIQKKTEPKPQPGTVEALQLNQSSPLIKQVQQIAPDQRPVDVSQLTQQKFPNRETLFQGPGALIGLGAIGFGIWMLINKEK